MRVRTRISMVRLGSREYRVIRPARPLVRAALYAEPHGVATEPDSLAMFVVATEPDSLAMFVGRVEAVLLTALWGLATCSPRTLVHLPMRHAAPPTDLPQTASGQSSLDLVLLHHRMQFPLSRWKQVRAHLGAGEAAREFTVRVLSACGGRAEDEASGHLWSLSEITERLQVGHLRFYDRGRYGEYRVPFAVPAEHVRYAAVADADDIVRGHRDGWLSAADVR